MEDEPQHPEPSAVIDEAVRRGGPVFKGVAVAARAHDDLAQAVLGVGVSLRILRGESLVRVAMAIQNEIGTRVMEACQKAVRSKSFGFGPEWNCGWCQ